MTFFVHLRRVATTAQFVVGDEKVDHGPADRCDASGPERRHNRAGDVEAAEDLLDLGDRSVPVPAPYEGFTVPGRGPGNGPPQVFLGLPRAQDIAVHAHQVNVPGPVRVEVHADRPVRVQDQRGGHVEMAPPRNGHTPGPPVLFRHLGTGHRGLEPEPQELVPESLHGAFRPLFLGLQGDLDFLQQEDVDLRPVVPDESQG